MITIDQMRIIMPASAGKLAMFFDPLCAAMQEFQIESAKRQAAFLAQIAVESGEFRYLAEIADGSEYEDRQDLGNVQPGDGRLFKGRGLIQITGRANYSACGTALKLPLVQQPTLLETPGPAARSATWYWWQNGCNPYADMDQFGTITHAINGGYHGLDRRIAYWLSARRVLSV